MRDTFNLHRIFSVLNLLLLVVLGYLVFNLILKDTRQEHDINSKFESTQVEIEPGPDSSDVVNHQIILERNIFNTAGINASHKDSQNETVIAQLPEPVAGKKLELRLLGTVAGNEEIACAIIEDTKTGMQDLYKTGDVIQGAHIERIERNRIILLNEGVSEILNLYVAGKDSVVSAKSTQINAIEESGVTDAIKVTSPAEREINKRAFLAKIGGIEAVLKTVEISPHTVNGKAEGLRISGLEDLSMAKFVGLQNNDIIQTINGQIVTDNRKAFQVLRKARALSSLDIQLMRGTETKTLYFNIK